MYHLLASKVPTVMPPKSKQQHHVRSSLENARNTKRRQVSDAEASGSGEIETRTAAEQVDDLDTLVTMSGEALDTDDEEVDPSFDLDLSIKSDTDYTDETFCEEWVSHLGRDDLVSLSLFLCFQLSRHLGVGETKAAELSALMIGKSDKTVREWRKSFYEHDGEIQDTSQGRYLLSGLVWSSEELNKKATRYIRENTNIKG